MYIKLICLLLIIKLTTAHYAFVPKFYGQDSAVIVDSDKSLPNANLQQRPYAYPIYQIIPPVRLHKYASSTEALSTTTTTSEAPQTSSTTTELSNEFPQDLLEIARNKLGLKSLDEIPSISELAELLGTSSSTETIKYLQQLTATDQGIALMKAYIESADYTDNAGRNINQAQTSDDDENNKDPDDDDDDSDDNNYDDVDEDVKKDDTFGTKLDVLQNVKNKPKYLENEKTQKPKYMPASVTKPGFLQRLAAYFNIYNIKPQEQLEMMQAATKSIQQRNIQRLVTSTTKATIRPAYVRLPLPYHYPIPLRLGVAQNKSSKTASTVHLNTPKMSMPRPTSSAAPTASLTKPTVMPSYVQLAKMFKIPVKHLEQFLQNKPKLAELANKVNNFPVPQQRSPMIDAQLMSAVQRAIEQDEDLKKLLNATTQTLK